MNNHLTCRKGNGIHRGEDTISLGLLPTFVSDITKSTPNPECLHRKSMGNVSTMKEGAQITERVLW